MSDPAHHTLFRAVVLLSCVASLASLAAGRVATAQSAQPPRASVMLGGFAVGTSRLALGKVELASGHWALLVDVTRDAVRERWEATGTQQASRGQYGLWAASAALRRYAGEGARGLFLEGGAGTARAELQVTPSAGISARRSATIPMASWGVGGRLVPAAGPVFIELAVRGAVPLATRHLYTDAGPPPGSTERAVSYQSWYFGRGTSSAQLYAGIGVSF